MKHPDQTPQSFDHIFIGSGCAALSLALRICKSPRLKNQSILLIDPQSKSSNDRTWCSWQEGPDELFSKTESISWQRMSFFSNAGKEIASLSSPYRYRMIRGDRFYQDTLCQLDPTRCTHLRESVASVDLENLEIKTHSGQRFRARQKIYNSSEQLSGVRRPARYEVWQHFYGIRIRTRTPQFDPEKVHFMDFRTPQEKGVSFFYLLPESAKLALIEYTLFSEQLCDQEYYLSQLACYIQQKLQLSPNEYEILSEEAGKIPMSSAAFPLQRSPQFLNIGSAGGLTKASTGYTFSRIQRDCELILHHLENPDVPLKRISSAYRFRFYDHLFLNLVSTNPQVMTGIFYRLFQSSPLPRILRFLDEDSNLFEEILIFFRLPWVPFLKALWRHLCGSFKSARLP